MCAAVRGKSPATEITLSFAHSNAKSGCLKARTSCVRCARLDACPAIAEAGTSFCSRMPVHFSVRSAKGRSERSVTGLFGNCSGSSRSSFRSSHTLCANSPALLKSRVIALRCASASASRTSAPMRWTAWFAGRYSSTRLSLTLPEQATSCYAPQLLAGRLRLQSSAPNRASTPP